jgi:hypothetical protein
MSARMGGWYVFAVAALVGGCSDPSVPTEPRTIRTALLTRGSAKKAWLPVGTVVPVGQSISATPEPFEPSRHQPLVNPTIEPNLVDSPGFVPPPKRAHRPPPAPSSDQVVAMTPIPPPPGVAGTADMGWFLYQRPTPWYGVYQVNDLQMSLALPPPTSAGLPGVFLYAPTLLAPGGSCLEVSQVYRRLTDGVTTGKIFGVFDWCQSGTDGAWIVMQAQVQSWQDRYVRSYLGRPTYTVTVVTPNTGNTMGQCWYAAIYDYLAGGYTQVASRCGNTNIGLIVGAGEVRTGWTLWESWYFMDGGRCPAVPSIRALDISYAHPDSIVYVPFSNYPSQRAPKPAEGVCWTNSTFSFDSPVPGAGS